MSRYYVTPAMRKAVIAAWLGKCAYCLDAKAVCVDHIVPLARGGSDDPLNYAAACQRCNSRKSDGILADGFLSILLMHASTKAPVVEANFARLATPAIRARSAFIGPRPKKVSSDSNMTLRVEDDLQAAFKAACKASDVSASQVLRAAMRDFVAGNGQPDLAFAPSKPAGPSGRAAKQRKG